MHYRYLRQKASASRKKDFREAEEAVLQVVEFEDGALGAGGGDLAVKAQPALLELGLRPLPGLQAGVDLLLGHHQVQPAAFNIDDDPVAIMDDGDGAALRRPGGDVPHGG